MFGWAVESVIRAEGSPEPDHPFIRSMSFGSADPLLRRDQAALIPIFMTVALSENLPLPGQMHRALGGFMLNRLTYLHS
jgi:hypothetical protein